MFGSYIRRSTTSILSQYLLFVLFCICSLLTLYPPFSRACSPVRAATPGHMLWRCERRCLLGIERCDYSFNVWEIVGDCLITVGVRFIHMLVKRRGETWG